MNSATTTTHQPLIIDLSLQSPCSRGTRILSSVAWLWRWEFPATFCRRLSGCEVTSSARTHHPSTSQRLAIVDLARPLFGQILYMYNCYGDWFCRSCWIVTYATALLEPLFVLSFSVERLIAIRHPLQVCYVYM